jgi:hypothetical protein
MLAQPSGQAFAHRGLRLDLSSRFGCGVQQTMVLVFLLGLHAPSLLAQEDHQEPAIEIEGNLIVTSRANREIAGSGQLSYWIDGGGGGAEFQARVSDGRFHVPYVEGISQFDIGQITIGSRHAYCKFSKMGPPTGHELRNLEIHWLPEASLTVYADGFSDPISNVELRQGPIVSRFVSSNDDPGFSTVANVSGNPPFTLVPRRYAELSIPWASRQRWFVRSPGYPWMHVDVDHAVGGNYRLTLRGNSKLVISRSSSGGEQSGDLCLSQVNRGGPVHAVRLPERSRSAAVNDLPAGLYAWIWRQTGKDQKLETPIRYIEIFEGVINQLSLDETNMAMAPLQTGSAQPSRIALRLEVPNAWPAPRIPTVIELIFAGAGLGARTSSVFPVSVQQVQSGFSSWAAEGDAPAGSAVVALRQFPWAREFPGGSSRTDWRATIPEPATIELNCMDLITGTTLSDVEVHCMPELLRDEWAYAWPMSRSDSTGRAKLTVPSGRVAIHAWRSNFLPLSTVVEASSTSSVATIALLRAPLVTIRYFSNGVPAYLPYDYHLEVMAAGGSGHVLSRTSDQTSTTLRFSAPGTYTLVFAPISGYQAIEPIAVDMFEDRDANRRIDLLRR